MEYTVIPGFLLQVLKEKKGGGVFVLECDESLGNVLTDNEWAGRCVAYH